MAVLERKNIVVATEGQSEMPIYRMDHSGLTPAAATDFEIEGIRERGDLQRLLKSSIEALEEGLFVVAEEFGEWLDSSRRIDLLCLDKDANLVVVELKRTDGGNYMDLQAIRYAAMISAMTFDQLVDCHARQLNRGNPDSDAARATILDFLGSDGIEEHQFGRDTRIILASADFGKELTTSVLWLRDRGIDISCIRLKPYRLPDATILVDIQQLIPLPEASNFQTQIGIKRQSERKDDAERHDLRYRFWSDLLATAKVRSSVHANRSPTRDGWINGSIGRSGFELTYSVRQTDSQVELWISFGAGQKARSTAAFEALLAQKNAIEEEFGDKLEWQELPKKNGCRVRYVVEGGYRSPVEEWPGIQDRLVDAMVRLDAAMRSRVKMA